MKKTILFLNMLLIAILSHAQQDIFKKHGYNKETFTLSKGKYKETFTNEDVIQIGTVLIDTRTDKIVEFLEEDTTMFAYKAETSSRFLTIDPLAEKYYNWSPYVYVMNNPMKYIDPTGMVVDDYFNNNGDYLGTDNSESQKIRIMNQTAWDTNKSNDGTIDPQKGQVNSTLLSESGVSDNVFLNVYQHYNPTDLKLSVVNKSQSLMQFTVKAVGNEVLDKKFEVDRKNILRSGSTDNIADIKNTFIHEEKHYKDFKEFGVEKYLNITLSNKSGRQIVENRAISTQIGHSTWDQTSSNHKKNIETYANRLGIIVPGLNANTIQPRIDITKVKIK